MSHCPHIGTTIINKIPWEVGDESNINGSEAYEMEDWEFKVAEENDETVAPTTLAQVKDSRKPGLKNKIKRFFRK